MGLEVETSIQETSVAGESSLQVERLVREFLSVIRTLVNHDPPIFFVQLIQIADRNYVLVVQSLCRAIPLGDLVGPVVISQILYECPSPSKEDLMGEFLRRSLNAFRVSRH